MFETSYSEYFKCVRRIRDGSFPAYLECEKPNEKLREDIQTHLLSKDFSVSELKYLLIRLNMSQSKNEMVEKSQDSNILSYILSTEI